MKKMYEITPCTDCDIDYLWEKFNEMFDECPTRNDEDAMEELFIFKVTDEQDSIIAGCVLDIDQTKIAEFNSLWVDERYRRQGLATALILRAEQKAKESGCSEIINAYTFDFQKARELFENLGYQLAGITKDWPRGHECYTLTKKLDPSLPEQTSSKDPAQSGFRIETGSEEDGEMIRDALEATYCCDAPRSHPYADISRKIVDDEGKMIAGCIAGVSGWDTLHIDVFWISGKCRTQDAEICLLGEIEREAKENGAYLARTGVSGRQVEFFKDHGYTVNVAYENEPVWYDMQKWL